jgi:hypothetical protein
MLAELTPSQRKALIEAVTADWGGWSDAWDHGLDETDREEAAESFLAGVRWAEREQPMAPFLAGLRWSQKEKR